MRRNPSLCWLCATEKFFVRLLAIRLSHQASTSLLFLIFLILLNDGGPSPLPQAFLGCALHRVLQGNAHRKSTMPAEDAGSPSASSGQVATRRYKSLPRMRSRV